MINLFNNNNKKNNKQYMYFKDGKIVHVNDNKTKNISNDTLLSDSNTNKNNIESNPKFKKINKILKPTLITLLIFGSLYVSFDIYKSFSKINNESNKAIINTKQPKLSSNKAINNNSTIIKKELKSNLNNITDNINLLSAMDNDLIKLSSFDIKYINEYILQQNDFTTTYDKLSNNLKTKKKILTFLTQNNSYKEYTEIILLFNIFEDRLNSSIDFSNLLINALNTMQGNSEISLIVDKYVEKEAGLKDSQNKNLISTLHKFNIKFQKDSNNENIIIK